MSDDPKAPEPQTPARDDHDNAEFAPGSDEGQGYPEESPEGANPEESDPNPSRRPGDRDGA